MVSDHLQVHNILPGACQRLGEHQHGTHITGTPKEKLSCLIPRFNPEGVVCVGVYVGGLNLEDVCWHGAVRLDAHVFVDDGG